MSQQSSNKRGTSKNVASKKQVSELEYKRGSNDDGDGGADTVVPPPNDDGGGSGNDSSSSSISSSPPKKYNKPEPFDKVEYAKLLADLFPSKYSKQRSSIISSTKQQKDQQDQKEQQEQQEQQEQMLRRSQRNTKQHEIEKSSSINKMNIKPKSKQQVVSALPIPVPVSPVHPSSTTNVATGGNYNIVINIKDPFEDLSDEKDYSSDMDDSVFDDESASNYETDDSDETYDDDDEGDSDEEEDSDEGGSEEGDSGDDSDDEEDLDDDDDALDKQVGTKYNMKIQGESIVGSSSKNLNKNAKSAKTAKIATKEDAWGSEDEATIKTIKAHMEEMLKIDKNNKIAKSTLAQMIEKETKIKEARNAANKKIMRKNVRKFGRLLHKKNSANDLKYFKKHLSNEQQICVLSELEELNKMMLVEKPYRLTLLESTIPKQYKAIALKRIQNLRYMDPGTGEYFKVKNWVDTFMTIPFGINKTLPITMEVGVDRCHEFMESAKDILDSAVYGLNDAKMQIMQMVGQWISNPAAMGSAIAIKGPPGTGKTTLVKDGISNILGRDFAFIALGGATDSSFLEGHSYTYEGSTWGKIVEILIRCKSMNPVIFFDELDKLSDTPKGEEIAGILTHLTDTSQNSQFHDKYFSEIPFDLSKCLFIFSYNDETKVNPILLDRMYRIRTNGYSKKDKTHIAQKYLIPKIQSEVAFRPDQIIIPDETIEYIVENHTNKEDGVRNLKRCLEIVYTKLNLYRLMKPGTKLFDKDATSIEVSFPFKVSNQIVDIMIKKAEDSTYPTFMYT